MKPSWFKSAALLEASSVRESALKSAHEQHEQGTFVDALDGAKVHVLYALNHRAGSTWDVPEQKLQMK